MMLILGLGEAVRIAVKQTAGTACQGPGGAFPHPGKTNYASAGAGLMSASADASSVNQA